MRREVSRAAPSGELHAVLRDFLRCRFFHGVRSAGDLRADFRAALLAVDEPGNAGGEVRDCESDDDGHSVLLEKRFAVWPGEYRKGQGKSCEPFRTGNKKPRRESDGVMRGDYEARELNCQSFVDQPGLLRDLRIETDRAAQAYRITVIGD